MTRFLHFIASGYYLCYASLFTARYLCFLYRGVPVVGEIIWSFLRAEDIENLLMIGLAAASAAFLFMVTTGVTRFEPGPRDRREVAPEGQIDRKNHGRSTAGAPDLLAWRAGMSSPWREKAARALVKR